MDLSKGRGVVYMTGTGTLYYRGYTWILAAASLSFTLSPLFLTIGPQSHVKKSNILSRTLVLSGRPRLDCTQCVGFI